MKVKFSAGFSCAVMVFALLARCAAGAAPEDPLPKHLNSVEIGKIKPAPADGHFYFIVMGDTRDGDQVFLHMMDLANRFDPAFIIDVGDLVHSGARGEYLHFYEMLRNSGVPFISVVGNHENSVPGGLERFVEMFGPADFYFDYGGARFIALDNAAADYDLEDGQLAWLEDRLKTDLVKFIFMHAPPRTRVWSEAMKKNSDGFMELVEKYGVRKVYFGHVHAHDRLTRGGTDYVMTGVAGAEPDPINRFYHPLSGGYYHMMLVEVRDGKVMDILVAPDTSDLTGFASPGGVPLEFPFASYRHFNAPVVQKVEFEGGRWKAGEGAQVTVTAFSHPDSLEVGLAGVGMECVHSDGATTDSVALKSDTFDERLWRGALPPAPAGKAYCSVRAEDSVGSVSMNLLSVRELLPGAAGSQAVELKNAPYTLVSMDADDMDVKVAGSLDILSVSMAYDEKHVYFLMELDDEPQGGSRAERVFNLYGLSLVGDEVEIVADPKALLKAIPVIGYAPLANSMGFPTCALFDLEGYREGKIKASDKGVKCEVDGNRLFVRAEREKVGWETLTGARVLAAAARLVLVSKFDARLADASNVTHVRFGGMPFEVE
ncbi:MAG: metallophosphoesterase [bacterium]